ncbi:uncharacterized protein LOC111625360 isoform X2 [Centruroides sculpturatus]|uniref:uncharacterized protein LOC111625360 isoform X1 n=1 Tax=Centruroides sculpturatus TaxID=218467 RepID=UPI000C6E6C3F|nr:uncharacterized protein LOC111625360 isoform X1 [Centruroides sculpturatus]XP_023224267.1 uncharacterized protein LOC111625360 isoform X2 [Centruroides sculpturatus]
MQLVENQATSISMIRYNDISKLNRRYINCNEEDHQDISPKQSRLKIPPEEREIQTQKLLNEVNIAAVLTAEIQKLQQELSRSEKQFEELKLELEVEKQARRKLENEHRNCIEMKELLCEMRELVSSLRNHRQGQQQQQQQQQQSSQINQNLIPISTTWPISNFPTRKQTELERSMQNEPSAFTPEKELSHDLCELLNITPDVFKRLEAFPTPKRYTAELMVEVFGREMLATHSLIGAKRPDGTSKPSLDRMKIKLIIDHVANKFQIPPSSVREAIRSKLNNEDKCFKKRLQEMRDCYTEMID